MNAEDTIKKLGIDLTHPAAPVANYVPAVSTGNLVYLSGKGPTQSDGTMTVSYTHLTLPTILLV